MNSRSPLKDLMITIRKNLPEWVPALIALGYLLIGGVWILLSDRFLKMIAPNPDALTRFQTVKGFWYVGITAALLWLALRSYSRNISRKEDKLRSSQERYRSLFTSSHEPILVADIQGRITDSNPALLKLFGYSLEEIQGKNVAALYHRKEQFQALETRLDTLDPEESLTETVIYRKKNQTTFPGETTVFYLQNQQGESTGYVEIIEDLTARYASQIALAEQEEEYRQLIEQAPVGVFQTTPTGQVVDINLRMAEILGCTSKEEALQAYSDLGQKLYVNPVRRQKFIELLKKQGQVKDFVYQAYKVDGSRIWLSMNARLKEYQEEKSSLIQGFATDITNQFRADLALKESEHRYRRHLERSFDGIAIHQEGRILFINQQGAEVLGADHPDQIIGKLIWEFVPESLQLDVQERMTDLFQEDHAELVEEKFLRLDGKTIDVEILGIPVSFHGEQAVQVVFRDISQRKWMEEALLQERNRAQKYLDIAGVTIIAVDVNGNITMINETGCQMLGYQEEELLGRNWFMTVLPPKEQEKEERGFKKMLRGEIEDYPHYPSPILTKSGERRIIEWHHVLLHDSQGEIVGTLSAGNDVTDKIQSEEQLRRYQEELETLVEERTSELADRVAEVETLNRALTNLLEDLQVTNLKLERATRRLQDTNKELESFTYSVSHDLRAPLRAVTGFSKILEDEFPEDLPEEAVRYLQMIQENAGQMETLIKDLLALSRFGRQSVTKTRFDPNQMVKDIVKNLLPDQSEREIEIQIDDLPPCPADPGLLKQVYTNLIENALKYTKTCPETKIEIGSLQEGGETIYYVRDNGVGFNMEYSDKLFGAFQRLHRAENYQGTGVGLAIVQRIIHKHGGRVWAEGKEGEGAVFYFTLPPLAASNQHPEGEFQQV